MGCWRATGPRYIVGIEFAGDGDVAVCVEAIDELFALVPEVGLSGEVGWRWFFTAGRRRGRVEGIGRVNQFGVERVRRSDERGGRGLNSGDGGMTADA